jgi:methylmalonyl-CoA mutase
MVPEPPVDADALEIPLAEGAEHTREEWEKATAEVLRKTGRLADDAPDADVWARLATTTLDGIDVTPLGTPELVARLSDPGLPGQAPYTRGARTKAPEDAWDVRACFADPDPKVTRDHVVTDLENGVTSLWLQVGEGEIDPADLAAVLEPVFVDLAPVVLDAPTVPVDAARALVAVLEDKGVTAAAGTSFGADPIGNRLRGHGVTELDVVDEVASLAVRAGVRALTVDGTAVHDLGGSDAQELAYVVAAGVAYLRLLTDADSTTGHDVDAAAGLLDFRLAVTDEQLLTIAKLRAARRLWARVAELSGIAEAHRGMVQHAVTSRPMMTRYDPYVNMLRTTVAAFAAGVGGAESVTVLPFDERLGLPEPFSRRIARNTSSLLIEESHVGAVTDPAGGSYAIEKLTDDLARAAWDLFGEIEAAGGVLAALDLLRDRIAGTVSERALQVARRQRPITGVSEFPHLREELPERRPSTSPRPEPHRYGAEFEQMRDEPVPQPVFLATMGPIAQHTARATFASNLLAAGGIDAVVAGATADVDAVVAAYAEAGRPPVAVLAGTDAAYGEWGAELVAALREAGATRVALAGKPAAVDAELDDSAAAGLDALAFLRRTREALA